ncbi:MAG TPA: nuclear transport factor 2 family protein [Pyrinomonadaceae bacterium]|nr:nuclear transport factor 2 family protein [Pyrinomonadaceae bacterium]HMP63976.1 nuclear transport factor 2 family protein [Pyrinomonadaceae bacterium]
MYQFSIRVFFAAALLCGAGIADAQTPAQGDVKAGREIMATIAAWATSVQERDTAAMDKIFADDVVITTYEGQVRGKAGELEAFKPNPNVRTTSIKNEDVGIKIFGEVGVVTALTKVTVETGGREIAFGMRYTAVFVKRDGRWQIVALQTTRAGN